MKNIILILYTTMRETKITHANGVGIKEALACLLMEEATKGHFVKLKAILINDTINFYNSKMKDEEMERAEKLLLKEKARLLRGQE